MNVGALPGLALLRGEPRYARWHAILECYAALSGHDDLPSRSERQCVVVGDDSLTAVVASLNDSWHAPPRYARSIEEALDHDDAAGCRPILFVVPRHMLTVTAIGALAQGVRGPWGIVTGRDHAAISFALVKQHAVRCLVTGCGRVADFVADVMGTVTREGHVSGVCAPSTLAAADLLHPLTQPTGSFLLLHCHGDGAHGNLGRVVLCGLCDDVERLADGSPGFCRRTHETIICKRSPDSSRQPMRCGDIGAATVCLLTCNGASVAGQGYPSDCSFVLSFAEGFPAAVLTTDRRLAFTRRDVAAMTMLLSSGRTFGEIALLLNDQYAAESGARPFVLFGDPTLAPTSVVAGTGERAAVEPAPAAPRTASRASVAVDIGESCQTVRRIAAALAQRLRLQDNILSTCARVAAAGEKLHTALDAHSRLLRTVRSHIGLGCELSGVPSRIDASELVTWFGTLAALIGAADRSLITLIHHHVPQRDLHLLFTAGLVATPQPSDRFCDGCGTRLAMKRHAAPLVAPGATITAECSYCGPEAAWDGDGPLIAAAVPRIVHAGSMLAVSVEARRAPLLPDGYALPALASIRFRDVGRSSDRNIEGCGIHSVPHTAMLKLGADTTLENNTVRVTAVHELSLGFQRAGVIVLPP